MVPRVQRVAGNRLFQVVVSDDAVAARCIRLMNEQRLGRLTFLPLTRLRVPALKADAIARYDREVHLLMTKLLYAPEVEKAVQTVWGKVLIARDSDVAVNAARDCDMECVTLAGDKVRYLAHTRSSVCVTATYTVVCAQDHSRVESLDAS